MKRAGTVRVTLSGIELDNGVLGNLNQGQYQDLDLPMSTKGCMAIYRSQFISQQSKDAARPHSLEFAEADAGRRLCPTLSKL